MKSIYDRIDDIDTELCSLALLQGLASRIAFGINVGEGTGTIEKTKLEECWTLLDLLKEKTELLRLEVQSIRDDT